jgi:ribosomal protein S18 acetylase RimI-like enzyme
MASTDPWKHFGYSTDECTEKLLKPGAKLVLASIGERVVGFACLKPDGDLGGPMINYVCVEPNNRCRGIGTGLVQEVLNQFPEASIYLTVSESNSRALRLYERLGFKLIGKIEDYNFKGEAEFILRYPRPPKREHLRQSKPLV